MAKAQPKPKCRVHKRYVIHTHKREGRSLQFLTISKQGNLHYTSFNIFSKWSSGKAEAIKQLQSKVQELRLLMNFTSLTATSGEKSGKKFCSSMVWSLGSFWPPGSQGLILTSLTGLLRTSLYSARRASTTICKCRNHQDDALLYRPHLQKHLCCRHLQSIGDREDLRSLKTHWELRSWSTSGRFVLSPQVSCFSYSPRGAALPPKGCQSQPGRFDVSWSSPAISPVPPPWGSGLAFWNRKDLHPEA